MSLLENVGVDTELHIIKTRGDLFLDRPLHQVSGRGIFVKEIDERMLSGDIDIAVHSMKDLPSSRPDALTIAAVLRRDSPYDVLASNDGQSLEDLKSGSVVGTSSMRRAAQLKRTRPDLIIEDLRGNLGTRLKKLENGDYDAIVLAEAGIKRMGYQVNYSVLDPEKFVPSANQGAIAVVAVRGRAEKLVTQIDHQTTRKEAECERIFLETIGGSCVVPMAAYARMEGNELRIIAEVLSLDGTRYVRVDERIPAENHLQGASEMSKKLAEMGGCDLAQEAVKNVGAN